MQLGVTGLDIEDYMEAIEETFAAKQKLIPLNQQILKEGAKWASENL
jgi:2-oxoisovalerate ferredoxin oxidoreductase beta subunit